jgi:hypothetical protein
VSSADKTALAGRWEAAKRALGALELSKAERRAIRTRIDRAAMGVLEAINAAEDAAKGAKDHG